MISRVRGVKNGRDIVRIEGRSNKMRKDGAILLWRDNLPLPIVSSEGYNFYEVLLLEGKTERTFSKL